MPRNDFTIGRNIIEVRFQQNKPQVYNFLLSYFQGQIRVFLFSFQNKAETFIV